MTLEFEGNILGLRCIGMFDAKITLLVLSSSWSTAACFPSTRDGPEFGLPVIDPLRFMNYRQEFLFEDLRGSKWFSIILLFFYVGIWVNLHAPRLILQPTEHLANSMSM